MPGPGEYWLGRIKARARVYDAITDKAAAIIQEAYTRAEMQISEDIRDILRSYRRNFGISEKQAILYLSEPAPKEIINRLKARIMALPEGKEKRRLEAQVFADAYRARIDRLQAAQISAKTALAEVAGVEIQTSRAALMDVADASYYRTMFDIQKNTGYQFESAGMSTRRAMGILREKWSGDNYSQRVWRNTNHTAREIQIAMQQLNSIGEVSQDTYVNIVANFEKGVKEKIDQARYAANRILATEQTYTANQCELEAYEDAGIEEYYFVAVLDGKTSEICQELDGKVFRVSEQVPGKNCPPMHPWCRSTTAPKLSYVNRAEHRRWSRNPATGKEELVPGDMTYKEWRAAIDAAQGRERMRPLDAGPREENQQ